MLEKTIYKIRDDATNGKLKKAYVTESNGFLVILHPDSITNTIEIEFLGMDNDDEYVYQTNLF